MRSDTLKRHKCIQQVKSVIKKDKKKRNRKSTNFFCTYQNPCKYRILKKLHLTSTGNQWITGLTVGNEWGCDFLPNGHCHMLISVQKDGHSLDEMKKILKEEYSIPPNDIQVAKSVKDSMRYISKEDFKCFSRGHDKDYLSIVCKAYLYSKKHAKFNSTRYPYCGMIPWQQKQFKEYLDVFQHEEKEENYQRLMEDITLRPWQKKAELTLLMQDDRKVLWIYDEIGGRGKTTLAKYLFAKYDAIILENGKTSDIAYLYNSEKYVIFDYTRSDKNINYHVIENLKNGYMFAPKYQSALKYFTPAKLICLSNNLPDITKLSMDRWHILTFDNDNNLKRHKI